jgi:hypothetical protein
VSHLPNTPAPESEWWGPLLRFIITVVIFALLLPGVGGVITILGYILLSFGVPSFTKAGMMMAGAMAYGLWLAYPIGLVAGGGMGAIVAARDRVGGTTLAETGLLGAGAGLLWAIFAAKAHERGMFTWLVIAATFLATLLSWSLTRWLRRWG